MAECDVNSAVGGIVTALYAREQQAIAAGGPIIAVQPDEEPGQ